MTSQMESEIVADIAKRPGLGTAHDRDVAAWAATQALRMWVEMRSEVVPAKVALTGGAPDTETVGGVVDATLIARGRAHWKKANDAYAAMHTAESDVEVAELARRMAAELYTYATYRDAMAGILYKGDSKVVNSWEGQK